MAAEMLNFGPEWLRALSSGGSVASPPSSPAMPKYKLAEYRYGREEMLALYVKDNKVPDEIQDREFSAILEEDPLQPLALVPLTEEEQRNFSMSVNSVAVLRLMGKGAGVAPAGVSRGRGSTRSRAGRGRGESGFYQRSIEEAEGGAFGRGGVREIHRSQSWDDRGDRRFEKPIRREGARAPFEEGAPSSRKEFARSDSDNWRTLREEHEEEEEGGGGGGSSAGGGSGGSWRQSGGSRRESERWRSASPDGGPRSAGWREHGGDGRRRKFDFDFREREEEPRGGRRHRQSSDSFEEEKDGLPEWCLEDEEEEMGTFDSSGAFMSLKKSPKELVSEEQELSFQPLPEEQEEEEQEEQPPEAKEGNPRTSREVPVSPTAVERAERDQKEPRTGPEEKKLPAPPGTPWQPSPPFIPLAAATASNGENIGPGNSSKAEKLALLSSGNSDAEAVDGDPGPLGCPAQPSPAAVSPLPAAPSAAPAAEFTVGDNEDEDGMKHLQQEAEKMVASLQDSSLEEEHFGQAMSDHRNTAAALPLSHEAAMKWFYKDPQGEIQGPFTTQEMAEWFQAGYFAMSLLVKRGCDEGFQPLGEVIKMWGRVPFAPGPSPPPLLGVGDPLLSPLQGNMDQERLKKQQELAAAAIYQQLQQQQLLQLVNSRQYAQCALQQKVASGDLAQQQQLNTFLQQLQALKPRAGEQGMIPSMNRSISVPDTGSLWDTHTSASPQAGGEASLWDIPINSSTQGPILEQLQLQHKLQERRGAELRAKRDEDERKRREEEELYRRKQARLPSSSSWGQQSVNASSGQSSFSLADLQKLGDARACRELREECRHQEMLQKLLQQQQQQSTQPLWGGLAKQSPSLKALLELQQESERHLQKPAQPRAQQRAHGGHGLSSLSSQWASDVGSLWGGHDKAGPLGLWEESMKGSGSLARNLGLRNSRSSPSLGDAYVSSRQSRKKTDEEEKLLKLLQGIHKPPQDGFTQWCEQMLHALNASSSLDVPTVVAFLKEMESPYDVHDCIRSCLGDTLEAKEFAKQFLERRAKQRANQQRQQQQQEASWLSSSSLQSLFQANHSPKPPSFENSQAVKIKRRPVMLHADPSILGYALHGASSELETVEDY
ncbi:GRB10-interacting GYF protein 1 isoform X2 [Pantherophis guttatus]|uniref:GRB10-interacting GYF protein 1 isoform X2 n=1 Tax=Pantherophis guttatus TaxID=94885 RepID=A0ABM3YX32_PANGU|nr:GRB10-interacting GYF protein 1 isoform X2 [Pantherophis guttatus]